MRPIKLSHANPLPVEEAKRRLGEASASYGRFYGVKQRWEGDRLVFSGALLNGHAAFSERSVDVEVTLGPGAATAKDHDDVVSGVREAFERLLRA